MTTYLRAAEVIDQQLAMGYDVRRYPHRLAEALAEAGVLADDETPPGPAEPILALQPGDVAIATVRGVEGVVVIRTSDSRWVSAECWVGNDSEVTVTSRAVVVTEADRDELLSSMRDGFDYRDVREWFAAKLGGGQ